MERVYDENGWPCITIEEERKFDEWLFRKGEATIEEIYNKLCEIMGMTLQKTANYDPNKIIRAI